MVFSTRLKNFLPFSSNLKLSAANSFSLGKGFKLRGWKCLYRDKGWKSRLPFRFSSKVFIQNFIKVKDPSLFPNKPWFLGVWSPSLLKILWEKEKLLVMSNFSFSHSFFLPVLRTFCHFHQIWNCQLQTLSLWKSLKFLVWARIKRLEMSIQGQKQTFYQNIFKSPVSVLHKSIGSFNTNQTPLKTVKC